MLQAKDIIDVKDFLQIREQKKADIINLKKDRKLIINDEMSLSFENTQTIWWQIQEMLRIEKVNKDNFKQAVEDELSAYNPLVPECNQNSFEISATLMIEIEDKIIRAKRLKELFKLEDFVFLKINGLMHKAICLNDTADDDDFKKISAVNFLKWKIDKATLNIQNDTLIDIVIEHSNCKLVKPLNKTLINNILSDIK